MLRVQGVLQSGRSGKRTVRPLENTHELHGASLWGLRELTRSGEVLFSSDPGVGRYASSSVGRFGFDLGDWSGAMMCLRHCLIEVPEAMDSVLGGIGRVVVQESVATSYMIQQPSEK